MKQKRNVHLTINLFDLFSIICIFFYLMKNITKSRTFYIYSFVSTLIFHVDLRQDFITVNNTAPKCNASGCTDHSS